MPDPGLAGRFEDGVHRLDVRIYYEDTDFSGTVYHANYLRFCERGRSDFLRLCGVHHHALMDLDGSGFVVRRMVCDFLRSARIDDVVTVETRLLAAKGARLDLHQRVLRGSEALFRADVTAALAAHGRPRRFPDAMAATLSRLVGEKPTS
jgi:acyl-CoA thioester hydrolase